MNNTVFFFDLLNSLNKYETNFAVKFYHFKMSDDYTSPGITFKVFLFNIECVKEERNFNSDTNNINVVFFFFLI